tara:strand:+ start:295 stop:954 length:660 start_codon:yes stop_codon:yes gene_type:complete
MSDYTIAVAWSGKDNLADSDANKVISGADFNTEFSAVRTAVNTKADINGDASEAFSCTTASAGTNTTQAATTAFVKTANDAQTQVTAAIVNALVYPVGSIYFNAAVATNPATLLGFGTWAAYAEGRVPVGKASSGTFDTLNATSGAETDSHTLTIAEMPSHTHTTTNSNNDSGHGKPATGSEAAEGSGVHTSNATGGGNAHTHDILQPYIVVYMWKRTA